MDPKGPLTKNSPPHSHFCQILKKKNHFSHAALEKAEIEFPMGFASLTISVPLAPS